MVSKKPFILITQSICLGNCNLENSLTDCINIKVLKKMCRPSSHEKNYFPFVEKKKIRYTACVKTTVIQPAEKDNTSTKCLPESSFYLQI